MRRTWAEKRREARRIFEQNDIEELLEKYDEYLRLKNEVLLMHELNEKKFKEFLRKLSKLR